MRIGLKHVRADLVHEVHLERTDVGQPQHCQKHRAAHAAVVADPGARQVAHGAQCEREVDAGRGSAEEHIAVARGVERK